ncbi:MAG TPA: diguanylate cyclase [Gaiellaceae bacterium]
MSNDPSVAPALHLVSQQSPDGASLELLESYRRLADVFHEVLSEQSLDALLDKVADALGELIPHDSLSIYEADDPKRLLVPVLVRDEYADKIMGSPVGFDEGITGWAARHREPVLANDAQLDPRVQTVPGTPDDEPEALVSVPLIARSAIKGVLNIYRLGDAARFSEDEFELAKRFGDAAALALDNAQIRARLEHQAQTDALTGLYNHRAFHERLRRALQAASRRQTAAAVVMLDIDDFKRVNDIHGHGTGDELLRMLADTLRAAVRADDVVCRLGGEEFAVIMTSCTHESALRLARRLVRRIRQTELPAVGQVTVSVGVALGPEHAMNPRELVTCAEAAMMTAKARGKNQIMVYSEGSSERPEETATMRTRNVRSIAHLKLLQSLSGKLNRLNDVREIGAAIASELRSLIDYHNCRVSIVDGEDVIPIAYEGDLTEQTLALPMELLRCKVGEGITGRAAQTGESLLIGDAANCSFARLVPGTPLIEESLLAVPLRHGSRTNGVIVVSKLGLNQFDEDDLRLLEVLAGHAAVAVENASLYQEARREADSATALLQFSRELATAEEIDEILARVVELSAGILGSARTSVWLQEDDGLVGGQAFWGYDPDEEARISALRFRPDQLTTFFQTGEPFLLLNDQYAWLDGCRGVGDFAVAPFSVDGRLGCIAATGPVESDQTFGERELRLIGGLAHQAKLAIANAHSFDGLERAFLETVEALANALEATDEYTSSHARWITDLSIKVGAELGLDGLALKRLELGALLHDIGKIAVPTEILVKPGRLTAEERAIMETHPELGEKIIAPIDRLQDVRPIVRHCHERWDGEGYPDQKLGEAIPLESRIIFVCDAFHAMTSDRPYRKRLTFAEARRRLLEAAGTQFDERVVEACLEVLESDNAQAEAA